MLLDPNNVRDVIDAFLLAGENDSANNFSEPQLLVLLSDLFLAGSETTGKSLEWACLFMVLHPDVRKFWKYVVKNDSYVVLHGTYIIT